MQKNLKILNWKYLVSDINVTLSVPIVVIGYQVHALNNLLVVYAVTFNYIYNWSWLSSAEVSIKVSCHSNHTKRLCFGKLLVSHQGIH